MAKRIVSIRIAHIHYTASETDEGRKLIAQRFESKNKAKLHSRECGGAEGVKVFAKFPSEAELLQVLA